MSLEFHRPADDAVRSKSRFRDLFKLMASPELPFMRVILTNTFAMSLMGLAIPLSIQLVINTLVRANMVQPLTMLCLVLFLVLIFSAVVQIIQTFTTEALKRRLFVRYGLVIAERLVHYEDESFKRVNSHALINRYFDVVIMQSSLVNFVVDGFGFLVMFVIGFGLLSVYHPYFLAFALAMTAFLIVDWLLFGPDGVRAGSPEADGKYDVVSWIEELSRVRNMFTSDLGRDYSRRKLADLFNRWLRKRNTLFTYQFRQHVGLQIFSVATNVLLIFVGGLLVLNRELSVGQLVAAALVMGNITTSLPRLQNFFLAVYDFSTSLDKIAQFYDYPLERETTRLPVPESSLVEFRDVHVAPDYRFDFSLPPARRIQVVVKSHSSFELLYDLVMHFRSADEGLVCIGGRHVEDLNIAAFRSEVQLVRRDQFFAGTIRDNLIGMSRRPIDTVGIREALGRIGLWSSIRALPDELETELRPNGMPLSESQLLGLQVARAMLTRPSLLFVTADFERIAEDRRSRILRELVDPRYGWTLVFSTQQIHAAGFDETVFLDRKGFHDLAA